MRDLRSPSKLLSSTCTQAAGILDLSRSMTVMAQSTYEAELAAAMHPLRPRAERGVRVDDLTELPADLRWHWSPQSCGISI